MRKGFSLIEIVLVVGMMATIIFVVASFRTNLNIIENILNQKLQSRQDIDQTMQILTTEIRSAGPSSLGAYPIESAATSSFVFYSDIDKDGLFDRVRYFFVGTSTIQKGVIKPVGNPLVYSSSSEIITTVVQNVVPTTSTPLFAYYDEDYTGTQASLASPVTVTDVRIVKISFRADINPKASPVPLSFSQLIDLRNLRSN